jgi:hypothetical protein
VEANMFGFFGLDPIHWIIIALVGSILIGIPIIIVVLSMVRGKRTGGGEKD